MSEWISVKDRLPESDDYVLCYRDSCGLSSRIMVGFYLRGKWTCGAIGNVTHWMPLPEPPEEVQNEGRPDRR